MDKPFIRLVGQWLVLALGTAIAAWLIPGIEATGGVGALLGASALLALFNLVLKPLLVLFTLPFVILTFGVGLWVINALLFMLVGQLISGFVVSSFWSALAGALVLSLTVIGQQVLLSQWKIKRYHQGQPGVSMRRTIYVNRRKADTRAREPEREVIDI
ncbi:MAG: phage holin family protein [Opitutales bacterium]